MTQTAATDTVETVTVSGTVFTVDRSDLPEAGVIRSIAWLTNRRGELAGLVVENTSTGHRVVMRPTSTLRKADRLELHRVLATL